ncbi:MAG: prolipoprotein diacylglyceryl transferase family protein, partial [Acidobacteriota bacterium]
IPDSQLMAVHPTQLYETLAALVIWGFGVAYFRRRPGIGRTSVWVIGALAVERFLVEFVRAKDDRFFGVLTLAQIISVLVVIVLLVLARRLPRERKRHLPA